MANEKILNTRIQLKYDTLANWNASTFIPKKGEVCIATVDTAQKDPKGNIITVPTLLIKVGSGEAGATFSTLPFVSAPAADVYDWAKKSEADFVAGFLSMPGMQDLLDGVFATDAELTNAIKEVKDLISALDERVTTAEGKIVTLEGKVEALEAGTYDDTEVRGLIKNNADAITAIKDGTSIDSFKDVEDALADKQAAGDYATNSALNAVNEKFADYSTTEQMNVAIKVETDRALEAEAGLSGRIDSLEAIHETTFATKAELEEEASTARAAEKANADEIARVNAVLVNALDNNAEGLDSIKELATWINEHGVEAAELTAAINEEKARAEAAEQANAKAIADQATSDANTYETKTDASAKLTEAKEYADQAEADAIATAAADATSKANTAETNAKAYADDLDEATNGRIDALTTDDIAAGTEVWVFNCGSATENID